MKQKDMITIGAAIFFSIVVGLIVSKFLIAPPSNRSAQVEVVNPITSDFKEPDKRYFNNSSIDPTEPIKIGGNTNSQPFDTSSN